MVQSRTIPRGDDLLETTAAEATATASTATEAAQTNSKKDEAKNSDVNVDVDAADSGTHLLEEDFDPETINNAKPPPKSKAKKKKKKTQKKKNGLVTTPTSAIADDSKKAEAKSNPGLGANIDIDANPKSSFTMNSGTEADVENPYLESITTIPNASLEALKSKAEATKTPRSSKCKAKRTKKERKATEPITTNFMIETLNMDFNLNENEDENDYANENMNANHSGNSDIPMITVTMFLILVSFALSVINDLKRINQFFALSIFLGISIVVLMILWIVKVGRRRNNANTHTSADDETRKFPTDCYSFVALYSPKTDPDLFCFGLLVYVFQASLFFLMISSVVHPSLHSTGGVDNPDAEFDSSSFAAFIPSNVSPIVRATQIIAVLTFLIFPEASFLDVSTGISMFPQLWKMYGNEQVWCMAFACVLRSIQGFMAIFATVVLIMSSSDVTQIVLSLIAVNFISLLDDTAFKSARAGTYGSLLEKAAKRIENEPIPSCSGLEHKYPRYQLSVYVIGVFMLVLLCFVIFSQEDSDKWITRVIQVKFGGSEDIHLYDGCYDVALDLSYNKRHNYKLSSDDIRVNQTQIGYCRDDRKWVLFNSVLDNPCQAEGNQLVAHSSKTDSFDVSTSFGDTWYSGSNEPLLLVLEELRENPKDCRSYLGDGICDEFFNKPVYEFDGGDCCATTCSHLNCGKGGLNYAPVFGTKIALDRFPNCKDPSMKPVTIGLNSISISDLETNPIVNFICDGNDVLSIPVDQSIEDYTETVMVPREGSCMFKPELEVKGFEWELCYTVSSEGTDISYEGCISWKRWIKENFFVYNVFDQTTLSSNIGELLRGSTSLILDGSDFTGTFPSEIGLLTELTELSLCRWDCIEYFIVTNHVLIFLILSQLYLFSFCYKSYSW
uniref:LNR domain-containing protein n=1 Tax=Pseudo-nitzschia australis TaxID=44445 RepID=A0A7S4ENQ3_9STRA